ncbi:DUF4446 domain-containing protein [Clostridium sp. chh4-2]|uniref:DUF4446 family protein n=1 Tax=Clostridium sp. chh4-2 TaxID=2067550 RepID=UPI000CCE1A7A|nr:DUF4446 family protein [Clostridium sp. chh4-2]PNV61597.1 DUF4446 domain-containing protein [Clostridium sp. chh4-2]
MENSMLNSWPIDPAYIFIGLAVVSLISLIVAISCLVRMKRLYRRYDMFMRGKDAESLEDIIYDQVEEIKRLRAEDRANKDAIRTINKSVKNAYQKFGVVRYNAFKGMGGNLSFAYAMLDSNNTGFILNTVHSREGCYLYVKTVVKGETEVLLGNEEKEALEQALGY